VLVATAVREEGASGAVDALVVALATLDGLPVPPVYYLTLLYNIQGDRITFAAAGSSISVP